MVLFEGGWDLRYAEVLAIGTAGRFGLALVDTNGDGREINDVLFRLAPEGWQEGSSSGGVPATGTGVLGQRLEHGYAPSFAYGRAKSPGPLRVQLVDGREVDVVANEPALVEWSAGTTTPPSWSMTTCTPSGRPTVGRRPHPGSPRSRALASPPCTGRPYRRGCVGRPDGSHGCGRRTTSTGSTAPARVATRAAVHGSTTLREVERSPDWSGQRGVGRDSDSGREDGLLIELAVLTPRT